MIHPQKVPDCLRLLGDVDGMLAWQLDGSDHTWMIAPGRRSSHSNLG
jgi:hypothetical protein